MSDEGITAIKLAESVIASQQVLLKEYRKQIKKLRSALLSLTDPTPLTVEGLMERGFVHDAIRSPGRPDVPCLRRGKLYVYGTEHADPIHWSWEHDEDGPSIFPVPRTVGELWQLLLRMEDPHDTP